ncbi:hypothetical protein SLS54_004408 [Diplodia seriata]
MDSTRDFNNDEDTLSATSKGASSAPTPATSTSSTATSTQPSEEQVILTDLRNYIPLGSLIVPGQPCESGVPGCWEELDPSQIRSLNGLDPRLTDSVATLLYARWVRVQFTPSSSDSSILRLWILPHDIARRFIDRNAKKARGALAYVVQELDVSAGVWAGHLPEESQSPANRFDPWATAEDSSLFYLFNTLPSPAPNPDKVEDPYAKAAMQDVLDMSIPGLKATLYPFQARSTALMLQREASQELHLDPRLEVRKAPDGQEFYYCPRDVEFLRNPRWYESNRSGILAEALSYNLPRYEISAEPKLVKAERRWVISGTPAKDDLLGVEVDLASNESPGMGVENDAQALRDAVLEQRKRYSDEDSRGTGASKSLGQLATHFLQVRPWAETAYEERADWLDYVYRHADRNKRRNFDAYSQCMKKSLEQLIIKTQPFDVERDLVLPPLTHRIVKLEPSFYDKISANLFVLVLTANAVTSERTDIDYLFHPRSQQARNQLITNLRQSNFFWTGFSEKDVGNAIEHGCKYLVKEDAKFSDEDRKLLTDCIEFAEKFVLGSDNWKAMSATHEVGLFVDSWPGNTSHAWALGKDTPELYGVAQLLQAQAHVNERLGDDPMEGFEAAGLAASRDAYRAAEMHDNETNVVEGEVMKMGLPSSSTHAEIKVSRLHAPSKQHLATPKTNGKKAGKKATDSAKETAKKPKTEKDAPTEPPRKRPRDSGIDVADDSPLGKTRIVGTVSAKLTYLLEQVMAHQRDEKLLIFYDGDNAAYYLAQCLDLLGVPHEIYSKGLSNELRSRYVVAFDRDPALRVLLMDVRLGALGLNVNAASRVYFVNPACRPAIEAQAVKRAHRIGQTRPVRVETLVLRGSVEEAVFERARAMTRKQHLEAKALEDDRGVADIIKGARLLRVDPAEAEGERQMAPLERPEQLFGRPGRGALRKLGGFSPPQPKRRKRDDDDGGGGAKGVDEQVVGRVTTSTALSACGSVSDALGEDESTISNNADPGDAIEALGREKEMDLGVRLLPQLVPNPSGDALSYLPCRIHYLTSVNERSKIGHLF